MQTIQISRCGYCPCSVPGPIHSVVGTRTPYWYYVVVWLVGDYLIHPDSRVWGRQPRPSAAAVVQLPNAETSTGLKIIGCRHGQHESSHQYSRSTFHCRRTPFLYPRTCILAQPMRPKWTEALIDGFQSVISTWNAANSDSTSASKSESESGPAGQAQNNHEPTWAASHASRSTRSWAQMPSNRSTRQRKHTPIKDFLNLHDNAECDPIAVSPATTAAALVVLTLNNTTDPVVFARLRVMKKIVTPTTPSANLPHSCTLNYPQAFTKIMADYFTLRPSQARPRTFLTRSESREESRLLRTLSYDIPASEQPKPAETLHRHREPDATAIQDPMKKTAFSVCVLSSAEFFL